jgi:hypothetical protein
MTSATLIETLRGMPNVCKALALEFMQDGRVVVHPQMSFDNFHDKPGSFRKMAFETWLVGHAAGWLDAFCISQPQSTPSGFAAPRCVGVFDSRLLASLHAIERYETEKSK